VSQILTPVSIPHSLVPQLSNLILDASWFYTLWWVHWSTFVARVSTCPPTSWFYTLWASRQAPYQ